jgi:restriction system protein
MTVWMVRAGAGGRFADEAREKGIVGLGWKDIGDPNGFSDKQELQMQIARVYPDYTDGQAASAASQLWRFRNEIAVGDDVVTYDSGSRIYHFGRIVSEAKFEATSVEELSFQRSVKWLSKPISRDDLSQDSRNRLGSTLTLFRLPKATADEIRSLAQGKPFADETLVDNAGADDITDPFESVLDVAAQRIADTIAKMTWQEMQQLVAALLRSMNYKTEISSDGPDRGRDVVASPDGFGFEQPRIVVEVKHRRTEKMDAPALRSFLGGRHKDDRGLYVSTGGFTKDAYYEADRSNIPLKLMTLEELARAVIENYENFDSDGRALLPLKKLYWPA